MNSAWVCDRSPGGGVRPVCRVWTFLRVLIDARSLAEPLTGIGRALLHTLQAMLAEPSNRYLLFNDHPNRPAQDPRLTWFGMRRYGFFTSPSLDAAVNRVQFRDVVLAHFPNYQMERSLVLRRNVVTIYDLTAEVMPACTPEIVARVCRQGAGRGAAKWTLSLFRPHPRRATWRDSGR